MILYPFGSCSLPDTQPRISSCPVLTLAYGLAFRMGQLHWIRTRVSTRPASAHPLYFPLSRIASHGPGCFHRTPGTRRVTRLGCLLMVVQSRKATFRNYAVPLPVSLRLPSHPCLCRRAPYWDEPYCEGSRIRKGGRGGEGVGSENRETTPGTTSTAPVHQLRGTANAQAAPAATSTAAAHQRWRSANAEASPAGAQAAAADRTQRPDAAREGNG